QRPLAFDGPRYLDARRDAELDEDVAHVRLDRLLAEVERARDLAVRLAFGDECRDLELARRQRRAPAVARARRAARLRTRAELAQLAARLAACAPRAATVELGLGSAEHGDRLGAFARGGERAALHRARERGMEPGADPRSRLRRCPRDERRVEVASVGKQHRGAGAAGERARKPEPEPR